MQRHNKYQLPQGQPNNTNDRELHILSISICQVQTWWYQSELCKTPFPSHPPAQWPKVPGSMGSDTLQKTRDYGLQNQHKLEAPQLNYPFIFQQRK